MLYSINNAIDFLKADNKCELLEIHKDIHKTHALHLTGQGLKNFLSQYDDVEDAEAKKMRIKLSNASTISIYGKALAPKLKVNSFTNDFFKIKENESNPKDVEIFMELLNSPNWEGETFFEFFNRTWLSLVDLDPGGLLMLDFNIYEIQNLNFTPKYLQTSKILPDGSQKSIILHYSYNSPSQLTDLLYHAGVDAEGNEFFKFWTPETISILKKEKGEYYIIFEMPNPFEYIPAVLISTNLNLKNIKAVNSYISESIGVADKFLKIDSLLSIYELKMGLPQFWAIPATCDNCGGSGKEPKNPQLTCRTCNGTGQKQTKYMTDVYKVDVFADLKIPIPPFGSHHPDVNTPMFFVSELKRLEAEIVETLWGYGSYLAIDRKNVTAFEVQVRSEISENKITEMAKNKLYVVNAVLDFIIDNMAIQGLISKPIIIDFALPNEFIFENSNELLDKYLTAKERGANKNILDFLYKKYVEIIFQNEPELLENELNELKNNPNFHHNGTRLTETPII